MQNIESMYQRGLYVILLKVNFFQNTAKVISCCVHNKFWFIVVCEVFILVEGLKGAAPFPTGCMPEWSLVVGVAQVYAYGIP